VLRRIDTSDQDVAGSQAVGVGQLDVRSGQLLISIPERGEAEVWGLGLFCRLAWRSAFDEVWCGIG
jgi:hypothetical protein